MGRAAQAITAYIGLGSNLGERERTLRRAVEWMDQTPGIWVQRVSALRETQPIGPAGQPDYLNAVAEIKTTLPPRGLLEALHTIEQRLGRVRTRRWGPRTVDLDILLYSRKKVRVPGLTIPHPEIQHRPFVQEALMELGVHYD
jgi:2-amino-4-hydroxy-6-hydroxymethyldihydropteridine diphosphokinase